MSMPFTEINPKCLAQTKVNREAVREWLDELGAYEFEIPPEDMISDPALLVAIAAKQCYLSFQPGLNPNVNRIRSDMTEYLDNILKSRHGSVLEHAVFTFGINGCSRVFTAEMNRHRAGAAVSERSMRFIRYTDMRYWLPTCFQDAEGDTPVLRRKKDLSRQLLDTQFKGMEGAMALFAEIWEEELRPESTFHGKKTLTSAFRRVIGMGVATGGVWSLNVRALRHICAIRTDESAEEEAVHIISKVGRYMIGALPELFGDFREEGLALIPLYPKV